MNYKNFQWWKRTAFQYKRCSLIQILRIISSRFQIIYSYQVILPNAFEDALATCKGICTTANEVLPNAGILASCNKVCHLVISVLLFIHTDYHAHLVKTIFTGLWWRLQCRQKKRSWGGRRHQLHSPHLSGRWSFDEVNVDVMGSQIHIFGHEKLNVWLYDCKTTGITTRLHVWMTTWLTLICVFRKADD